MYGKSPERWRRQKVARPPTFKVENEHYPEETPQYFQITINLLEAQKIAWPNPHCANSYVVIVFGKKKFRSAIRKNTRDPYYNECFIYELFNNIHELKQSIIRLAVMEPRCYASSKLLGEASIDLGAIWDQPNHGVFHKWVQLILPRNPNAGPVGFLKVDISVAFLGDMQLMRAAVNQEPIDNELLLATGLEQQRANYLITVYSAFGLPSGMHCQGGRRYGKPPNTFVRVCFCGLVTKTAVQYRNNNPMYCEQISIVEMFPSICQTIRLDICSTDGGFERVLASTNLELKLVSHDGENGFLPTFGPSLLHIYGSAFISSLGTISEDGPFYRGALLVSLKAFVPYHQQCLRSTSVEPITPIKLEHLLVMEDFCVYSPILEVSMLDLRLIGKISGVAITIGEIFTTDSLDEEFSAVMLEMKSRKLHYTGAINVTKCKHDYGYLHLQNGYPVLQLATRLPDYRFRMFRNNFLQGIIVNLETSVSNIEKRLRTFQYSKLSDLVNNIYKSLADIAMKVRKFHETASLGTNTKTLDDGDVAFGNTTDLDHKQLSLQKEEMEEFYQHIMNIVNDGSSMNTMVGTADVQLVTKKGVKLILAELKAKIQNLRSVLNQTPDGWPDIIIWLLSNGSRVAYARIKATDILHSMIPEQRGVNCGRIQSVLLKPIKCTQHNSTKTGCYCVAGKLEADLWMGLYKQIACFEKCLPNGFKLRVKGPELVLKAEELMLECRIFVYKAKLGNVIVNNSNIGKVFVRINILNSVKDTKADVHCSTPEWNQLLRIQKLVFTSQERVTSSPPSLVLELYGCDFTGKPVFLGRNVVAPIVDDWPGYEYTPKAEWYEINQGEENIGRILMSVQLFHVPEQLVKMITYTPLEEKYYSSDTKGYEITAMGFESIPQNLIPKSTTYKIDVYWWGLRNSSIARKPCAVLEIEGLTIKSEFICDKKVNSNFPNGKSSHFFDGSLTGGYDTVSVRLLDSGTFGRTMFLGTKIVKNPFKYVVNWIAQNEREASLRSASITSSDFSKVNDMTYVKKSLESIEISEQTMCSISNKNVKVQYQAKISTRSKFFGRKEPTEEEYVLLPIAAKIKHCNETAQEMPTGNEKDWWMRYLISKNDYNEEDKLISSFKITIYESELEAQPEYSKFKDWCSSLKFYNGNKTGIRANDKKLFCGVLKVGLAVYSWPPPFDTIAVSASGVDLNNGYYDDFPTNESTQYLVRVYFVRGMDLKKKNFSGKSDTYVLLNCGKKVLGDRSHYVGNNANPVFGRMHEFHCNLPEDYLLTVSLYDYNAIHADELIGSTTIDLEDRIFTKHRARAGLAREYNTTGPYKWRDSMKPSEILEELCSKNHLPPPLYPEESAAVIVNGIEYRDSDVDKVHVSLSERKENICVTLLHQWHTLPVCGYHLVPEHIETRSLRHPEDPFSDRGKIEMWVDIFSINSEQYIPPPVDIIPRNADEYELRLIVWQVRHLIVDETIVRSKYPDIFVRAWIGAVSQSQDTDIHYRCSNGEGVFNWRMIFDFQYQHTERKIIINEKGPFTEYKERVPPVLVIQVMDTEAVLPDDSLGILKINLNCIPRGEKLSRQCNLETIDDARNINLFTMRSIRAWWPLYTVNLNTNKKVQAGVVDLEMTLIPKEKALLMPLCIGRCFPNRLPETQRRNMSKSYLKFSLEDMCCYRIIILFAFIVLIAFLCTFVIYFDVFSRLESTEWIRVESGMGKDQPLSLARNLYPVE